MPNRGERGAVLVFVALVLPALMAISAIAVDLASARSESVAIQTATDSAALAAVPDLPIVEADPVAATAARTRAFGYVRDNLGWTNLVSTSCSASAPANSACWTAPGRELRITTPYAGNPSIPAHQRIRVEACKTSNEWFASAIGAGGSLVCRSSVASGARGGIGGLRPFGLCAEATPTIRDVVRYGVIPSTPQQITYAKSQPSACNGGSPVPGNWGMIDFNGGANSNAETRTWVEAGFPGLVESGTEGVDCTVEPDACYEGDTGAFSNSLADALQSLQDAGTVFALPVFDRASGTGANALIHLVGFVTVRLVDFEASGAAANRYLTIQVVAPGMLDAGVCCVRAPTLEG